MGDDEDVMRGGVEQVREPLSGDDVERDEGVVGLPVVAHEATTEMRLEAHMN